MSYQQGQPPQWPPPQGQSPTRYPPNQGWGSPQQPLRGQQPGQPMTPYPPSYQQQYYQQMPPPMMQQPPKKKSRAWLWIILGIIAVLIVSCIGFSAILATSSKTTPITAPADTQSTGGSSSSSAQPNTIGKPVVVNSDWTVTLNSVKMGSPGQFDQLKPGDTILIVNVSLKNTSSSVQHASSLAQWALHDASGQTYNQDIITGSSGPDGTVAPGSVIRGDIAYEVSKSQHAYTLQFVADIGSNDLAEWNVNI